MDQLGGARSWTVGVSQYLVALEVRFGGATKTVANRLNSETFVVMPGQLSHASP